MRVEHDGQYAIVASLEWGAENRSGTTASLKNPRVPKLQDGTVTGDHDARGCSVLKGHRWQRAVAVWPDYASYQTKTDRQIPVFVLTPVRAGG